MTPSGTPAALAVETTPVPGLLVVRLPVHADPRGWFRETWQRAKMTALGVPDLGPVQANLSFNTRRGVTRGLHAEPWDKMVSVATGRALGAWVDLREGPTYGLSHTVELDERVAVFVPRGVANGFQTLTDDVAYTYLVNGHWNSEARYLALALDDPVAAVAWPIPLAEAEVSDKDRTHPRLHDLGPVPARRTLVLGATGQVGRALTAALPEAEGVRRDRLDLADLDALRAWPWQRHDVVINAAAWTAVDDAETTEGRAGCWRADAEAPSLLARLATEHGFRLVHYSSDYVYDGSREVHTEDEPLAPLGVYGQAKAAGDLAVLTSPGALVVRTSWVVGDGANFVRTMARLAREGACPQVVADQVGRLSFAEDLAAATVHLLQQGAEGVVHVTNGGDPLSWADLAREIFSRKGRDPDDVVGVSTEQYAAGQVAAGRGSAPRPRHSTMSLERLAATSWTVRDQLEALADYLERD